MSDSESITQQEREELLALRDFRRAVVARTLDALIGGREISGADFMDSIADVVQSELERKGDPVFVAVGDSDQPGYWNNDSGWSVSASYQQVELSADKFSGLSGLLGVIPVSVDDLGRVDEMPELGGLDDIAEDALDRAEKHGFTVDESNAAEVMTEEIMLSNADAFIPQELSNVLGAYLLREMQRARERPDAPRA